LLTPRARRLIPERRAARPALPPFTQQRRLAATATPTDRTKLQSCSAMATCASFGQTPIVYRRVHFHFSIRRAVLTIAACISRPKDWRQSAQIIGNGAYGKVYRATWRGKAVAVKELKLPMAPSSPKRGGESQVVPPFPYTDVVCFSVVLNAVMYYQNPYRTRRSRTKGNSRTPSTTSFRKWR
jgi:hypothetical protein